MDRLAARLAGGDLNAVEPHAAALERWLALGGDDAEARLGAATAELGSTPSCSTDRCARCPADRRRARVWRRCARPASTSCCSTSRRTTSTPTVWSRLRALLAERAGGVVLVSHDRALLEEVVQEVIALDPHTGQATAYAGGWAAYERERDAARARALAAHEHALAARAALRAAERETRERAARRRARRQAPPARQRPALARVGADARRRHGAPRARERSRAPSTSKCRNARATRRRCGWS